ncbi:MAG: OmpA family protein [Polyangia bacterium]
MRIPTLACVATALCIATPAHAEGGRLNLHLNLALTATASAFGLMGNAGLDWQFHAPFALDVNAGGGHLGLFAGSGDEPGFFTVAAGVRVRLFDNRRGYRDDPGGRWWGNWYVVPRVGYLINRNDDSSYAVAELETGIELAVGRPVQLGPFARLTGAFGGSDFAFFVIGVSLSAEIVRRAPDRPPAPPRPPRPAGWMPGEEDERGDDSDVESGPTDNDKDGVVDAEDACPDTKPGSKVDRRGCAVLEPQMVLEGITFMLDSAQIQPASEEALARGAQLLRDNPSARVEIGGHTCDLGSDAYNLKLSEARAAAVADWLVAHGIDRSRLEVRGYGNTQPKVPNDSEDNRALNRRIEFRRLDE